MSKFSISDHKETKSWMTLYWGFFVVLIARKFLVSTILSLLDTNGVTGIAEERIGTHISKMVTGCVKKGKINSIVMVI